MSDRILIQFNKKHNEDQSIPPWICITKGQTYYVSHINIEPGIGFSTKERPDHATSKACLYLKGTLKIENGEANISP